MVFLFNQDGSISLQHDLTADVDTERVTIRPTDMALVVDVLLVAIDRAAGLEPAKARAIGKEAVEDIASKIEPQESQIDRVLKEWHTLEDLDPTLKITSDPQDLRMNVDYMVEMAKGVSTFKRADEMTWMGELRRRYSYIDANTLARALHQIGVYGSIKIQHGATL